MLPPFTRSLLPALAALPLLSCPLPARALDRIDLEMPVLGLRFSVSLAELENPEALWQGTSDLAEINRASRGVLGRRVRQVFHTPLPLQTRQVLDQVAGTPLLEQALLVATALGQVDGLPPDLSGELLTATLERASVNGDLTLLSFLRAVPGESASVNLPRALGVLQRTVDQRRQAGALVESGPVVGVSAALTQAGGRSLRREELALAVNHRPVPLQVLRIQPERDANGRLVVISHGLWDRPESFEGWARHLASHGYRVLLPRHPGSDSSQQQAMLSGKTPPPSPEELLLRPRDVSAVIDADGAAAAVVIGHSWGATTALQLAGAQPSGNRLRERCRDLNDPERNPSWLLQCSFLDAADRAGLADARVRAVAAVSPPLRLLFDDGAEQSMSARALLVSGSRDWVVTPDPEAVEPFQPAYRYGHQLVLAAGGDHFNLRAPAEGRGGPLAALLLAWVDVAYAAGEKVRPAADAPPLLSPAGWGSAELPLVLVR
ncbi:MAG: alpha/beta fold hydrolase [Prochlorococcaceae cyanobacterium]